MSENKQTGAFRRKKVYFSQVSNVALRDNSLSLKAKGLYALIQSYITLEDFTLYKSFLLKQCIEGRDAFNGAWNELKKQGYLIQYKVIDEKGLISYEYDLLDFPCTENPYTENPSTENPYNGQAVPINNTENNNTDFNNNLNTTVASKDAVVSAQEEVILKDTNIKSLSDHQRKQVATWNTETLIRAIAIYKQLNGQYFKLLDKIYKDGAVGSLIGANNKFTNIQSHKWDLAEIEKREREHIEELLRNIN